MTDAVQSISTGSERLRQVLGAFYKTVDVMKSARNSENRLMNIWADDMKAVEDVMLLLEQLRDSDGVAQARPMPPDVTNLLKQLAWYYEVNDCAERHPEDALEVPLKDLKAAFDIYMSGGESPRAQPVPGGDKGDAVEWQYKHGSDELIDWLNDQIRFHESSIASKDPAIQGHVAFLRRAIMRVTSTTTMDCKADFYALWCDACNTHPMHCKFNAAPQTASNAGGDKNGARISNWLADYSQDLMEEGDFDQEAAKLLEASQWIADHIRDVAYRAVDPRIKELADKIRTAEIHQVGDGRFALLNLILPIAEKDAFADALSLSSTEGK